MMRSKKRVAVVGGGVVGLTCAYRISDDHSVCVIGEKIGPESDSWKATAVWHVYLVPETEEVLSWAQRSLEVFYDLAQDSSKTGVELVQGVELFRRGSPLVPTWSHIPRLFEMLTPEQVATYNPAVVDGLPSEDVAMLSHNPVKWGYRIEAPAARMDRYLSWLEESVRNKQVEVRRRRLASLNELEPEFDLIINCSGFGARELVDDTDCVPYKGQYFVLKKAHDSPTVYIGDDDHPGGMAYMIPRFDEVMVGGCAEQGKEDLQLTLDWTDTIRRAGLFVPWLRDRSQSDQSRPPVVGIRPCRTKGVRLESDYSLARIPVIHNYGHGGSGFSLSWGCAEAVGTLIKTI
jgi:D-amino-acid oxidase